MTAEIAVVNKSAVALAADSKVTVGRGANQKTYDTVNKLFTLSKFEPVGIMIYGNAEFMGFPWETIIKTYRNEHLKDKRLATIQDYADDFFAYICTELSFKREDWSAIVTRIAADKLIKLIMEDEREEKCDREIRNLKKRAVILKRRGGESPIIARVYKKEINAIIDLCFEDEEVKITPVLRRKLITLIALSVISDDFSSYMSGVVFAGFGGKEKFPSVIDYNVEGIISGILKYKKNNVFNADRNQGGYIKPFAQGEMVFRFMEGIDSEYQTFLEGMFLKQIIDNFGKIFETYYKGPKNKKDVERQKIFDESISVLKGMREKAREYRRKNFAHPILSMLDALPKEELAHMAESLVSLTALKRKVSEDLETVGGAIDVAVISKGDGFIWIKRKHYFNPSLNQSFGERYLRI